MEKRISLALRMAVLQDQTKISHHALHVLQTRLDPERNPITCVLSLLIWRSTVCFYTMYLSKPELCTCQKPEESKYLMVPVTRCPNILIDHTWKSRITAGKNWLFLKTANNIFTPIKNAATIIFARWAEGPYCPTQETLGQENARKDGKWMKDSSG